MWQHLRYWLPVSPILSLTGSSISSRNFFRTGSVFLFSISVGILLVGLFPGASFADTIANQTEGTASSNYLPSSTNGYFYQNLGVITGTVTSVTLRFTATTTIPTGNFLVALYQCGTSAPTGCGAQAVKTTVLTGYGAGSYEITSTFDTPVVYDGTGLGTQILIQWNTVGLSNILMSGCTPSCYSAGTANGHPSTPLTGIDDFYFVVSGAIGQTQSTANGIKTIISPTNQSTTANNTPTFSYTYYYDSAQGSYDRVGFLLRDLTNESSVNTAGASSSISASGLGTFSNPFGVITGHLYEWQPIMYSTTGASVPLYGSKSWFYAVTSENYQSIPDPVDNPFDLSALFTSFFGSSTSTNLVATSTASSTNPGVINYTTGSTTPLARCFSLLPDNLRNSMATHMPFSYVCDAQVLIYEMINGSGGASGDFVLTYPTVLGHDLATSTTIIDKEAIVAIPAVQTMKTVLGYAIYLSTAFGIMWAVLRVI